MLMLIMVRMVAMMLMMLMMEVMMRTKSLTNKGCNTESDAHADHADDDADQNDADLDGKLFEILEPSIFYLV